MNSDTNIQFDSDNGNKSTTDKPKDEKCNCTSSFLFPHRKSKCAIKNAMNTVAPGLYVRNESKFPILFVLSQLTPLHWMKVEAGQTKHISCGRVFFTLSTEVYNPETVPTEAGVAMRLAAITTTTVFTGNPYYCL